jgi:hypothetical protein
MYIASLISHRKLQRQIQFIVSIVCVQITLNIIVKLYPIVIFRPNSDILFACHLHV